AGRKNAVAAPRDDRAGAGAGRRGGVVVRQPADRCVSGHQFHAGQDHPEGARHDARGSRKPGDRADRDGDAGHPRPERAAFGRQVRDCGHHDRLQGRHRYLSGAEPGGGAPERSDGRPAQYGDWRPRADFHPVIRHVHVHAGRAAKPCRKAAGTRSDHPSRAAHGAR
ncbi:hypothetical protein OY671_010427, partial [Metschnikowia pulcherrima]